MVFSKKLAPKCALGVVLKLESGVTEENSFKSKDFSSISYRRKTLL